MDQGENMQPRGAERAGMSIRESEFKVEWIPINKLKPAVYNPRKDLQPGDPEYVKIQKSLNEFGLVDPLGASAI